MTQATLDLDQVRSQLVKTYRKLPPLEKLMVQLFSVIYEPISRSLFCTCMNYLSETERAGKNFYPNTAKPYLDRLIEQKILIQPSGTGPQCNPLISEIVTRDAIQEKRFERLVKAVEQGFPAPRRWKDGPIAYGNDRQLIREIRVSLYRGDLKTIEKQLKDYYTYSYVRDPITLDEILLEIITNPFDPVWFDTLPDELYEAGLISILTHALLELTPAQEALDLLHEDVRAVGKDGSVLQWVMLSEHLIMQGRWQEAQEVLEQVPNRYQDQVSTSWGMLDFFRGDNQAALAHYTVALQALKKGSGKRKIYFQTMSGLFFILALLKDGSGERLQQALEYAGTARQAKSWLSDTYAVLENLVKVQMGDLTRKAWITSIPIAPHVAGNCLETLICSLCLYWVDLETAKRHLPKLIEPFYIDAYDAGYLWLAKLSGELLSPLLPTSPHVKQAVSLLPDCDARSIVQLIQPKEAWELSLNALTSLRKEPSQSTAAPKAEGNVRLVWYVTQYLNRCTIQPREQSRNAKGEWGKGRPIALKRLMNQRDTFPYLTPQDHKICAHIKPFSYGWNNQIDYTFDDKAIVSLIGHPLVFWEDAPGMRVEVIKGEPELLVKKGKGDRLTLQFSPELKENGSFLTVKESPTRLKVIEITPEHRRIAEILGQKNRLEVPAAAKERVLEAIHAISGIVTVHSDIGGGVATEEVPSDPKPHIHLLPANAGLKVAVLSRPFANDGPYYRPGSGGETVIAEIDGKRLQTTRNLREEKKLANAAIADCPTLAEEDNHENEWLIDDPESCLELLLELQALGDRVTVEHPEGEKFRVAHQAGLSDFRMAIKRQNDWFATEGELKVSNEQVLDMQQLMQLLNQTNSRFIPLGNGQFLALTQEFRKRLDELRTYADKSGKGLRLHPLAAMAVEDWIDEVGNLKTDKHWKAHLQRLKEIQDYDPQLPSTLQAELRDYQLEGFRWLARLAHWGVGACLADDMGLGKTLQSLAVILTRAPQGATLIIAPTSVCMNWISEAEKFAPTLNVLQFGSGDRQKMLDNLQPFDIVVCSYGLLQQEEVAEMLAKVEWQTIVLDEAQSIKNFATKRSQAAMNLQGGFKLITTGTPIENHLGELWNLFRFINPGLLGSLESFNQRFANPIEREGDRQARQRLKKLIQPFLLRRTKSQVLQELPSRTEILLQVDLSKEEMAFYEALRREAIAKLSDSDATAGAKHLQVLAEIMRLRRACCNTKLVKPEITLPSSKLQLFGEILTELLENKHKALVFSQFVDHLHILRDYLDSQKIAYQYLDGSTPANDRKKRVTAFQSGEGDVFLISLKAGGTGLNLTAADYVIHMDPWWNPAVEDQASDRAHRIGQQRPVTIYRLVAKDTIEEKIVELHHRKRDLADSLLEGTDMSGKISTDELLRLIAAG
ncbi:DEAD/DEAH box helicase [Leptolyngbya ohadii]|uniref:DEAD/DEAH box helicase n=1 Tax=Leptolyngbya ohadii TaxID=1962290 RepID=UPI000B59B280|nr:DEAD/DEAH box helicase [Leptolyngbya ohadii]